MLPIRIGVNWTALLFFAILEATSPASAGLMTSFRFDGNGNWSIDGPVRTETIRWCGVVLGLIAVATFFSGRLAFRWRKGYVEANRE